MTTKNANEIRAKLTGELYELFIKKGEDCGMIASNSFNFPIVASDGEEGWATITIKVAKKSDDNDQYEKRNDYKQAQEKHEKAKEEAAKKKKKYRGNPLLPLSL